MMVGKVAQAVLALSFLALSAVAAQAGTVTGSSGPFKVNGAAATVPAGGSLALKRNDVVDTMGSSVSYRSDTGDALTLERGSLVREEETTATAAGLFVLKGAVTGIISDKTQVGVAAGWASAPAGQKCKVLVECTPGREAREALFRAVEGSAYISYRSFNALLLPQHSVTLDIDPNLPGTLRFRTGQQNAGEVKVARTVAAGEIIAWVPKASLGSIEDQPENKTKVCNDINSLKSAKIRLQTRFAGKGENTAAIGPGTCALIDNATGAIQVLFAAVQFEILDRAISLTSEFSTLAQSNFSDVK
jgi:hypothetical protein